MQIMSGLETWVTERAGDTGYTFAVCLIVKPLYPCGMGDLK